MYIKIPGMYSGDFLCGREAVIGVYDERSQKSVLISQMKNNVLRTTISSQAKNCSPALNFCTSLRTGAALSSPSVYKKFQTPEWVSGIFGTPKGTRTPDLLVRSQSLYPTELSAHTHFSQVPTYSSTPKTKMQALFSRNCNYFSVNPHLDTDLAVSVQ